MSFQNLDMLEARQLQIFMALWHYRNFSRAAEAIYLTQPTISGHLKALEEYLGVKLFDRTPKEVVPTQAAKLLYPYVKEIMSLNNQALEEIRIFLGEEKGELKVGASNIPGQYILPPLLGQFKKLKPKIEIKLTISDTTKTIKAVEDGEVELGLVGAKIKNRNIKFEKCFDDELLFVVGPNHRFVNKDEITLEEMMDQPFVARELGSGTRLTIEKALWNKGIDPNNLKIVLEMGSTEAVRQAVKSNIGCAIISKKAIDDDLSCGLLYPIKIKDFSIVRAFYLITLQNRTLSPVANSFVKFLNP